MKKINLPLTRNRIASELTRIVSNLSFSEWMDVVFKFFNTLIKTEWYLSIHYDSNGFRVPLITLNGSFGLRRRSLEMLCKWRSILVGIINRNQSNKVVTLLERMLQFLSTGIPIHFGLTRIFPLTSLCLESFFWNVSTQTRELFQISSTLKVDLLQSYY